ncbi:MAG: hypothetical protein MUW55_11050 [Pantoea vagans]|nr:hypothetical protein [Pantoea vagans]
MAKKADGTEDNTPDVVTEGGEIANVQGAGNSTELQSAASAAFVTMVRNPDIHPAPHTAQVHPDEVHNYYSGGWTVKKEEAE